MFIYSRSIPIRKRHNFKQVQLFLLVDGDHLNKSYFINLQVMLHSNVCNIRKMASIGTH